MIIEFQEVMNTVAALACDGPETLKRKDCDQAGEQNYAELVANVEGKPIVSLQRLLRTLGAQIEADGVFGGNTEDALQQLIGKPYYDLQRGDLATLSDLIVAQMIERRPPPTSLADAPAQTEQPKPQLSFVETIKLPPFYRQADPDWTDRELGKGATIGKKGCAMCCCAMAVAQAVGDVLKPITPAPRAGEAESPINHLDVFLDQNNGYDGNSIYWGKVTEFAAQHDVTMRYESVRGLIQTDYYTRMRELLAQGVFPIVRILHPRGLHFMLAIRATESGDVVVHDPGTRHGDGSSDNADNILSLMPRYRPFEIKGLDLFRVV